jgi:hypothetical protein
MKFEAMDLSVSQAGGRFGAGRIIADPDAVADEVVERIRAHSLHVADVRLDGPQPDIGAVDALVAFARRCNAAHATWVYHPGQSIELIQRFAAAAQAAGLDCALEAGEHVHPEAVEATIRQVSGLTISLDYGTFLQDGITESEVNTLLCAVSHLRVRGTRPGAFQVAWKENSVNYQRTVEILRATGYDGVFAADYVWDPSRGRNRNDVLGETLQMRASLEHATSK